MKTRKTILFTVLLLIGWNLKAQIKVETDGDVGVGSWSGALSEEFNVKGKVRIDHGNGNYLIFDNYFNTIKPYPSMGWNLGNHDNRFSSIYLQNGIYYGSDKRQKTNIKPIETALEKIVKLDGVKFDWKEEIFKNEDSKLKAKMIKDSKNKLGFLAQDLQKVLPELVLYDKESDNYSVDYVGLIPVLVEGMKEQQSTIKEMENKIAELESCCSNNFFKSANKATHVDKNASLENAALYQNKPNPFSTDTEIEFSIPEEIENAFIGIYDLNGTQMKSISVSQREKGSITISANELKPGMYFYSLFADGYEIDTKRMVITEN